MVAKYGKSFKRIINKTLYDLVQIPVICEMDLKKAEINLSKLINSDGLDCNVEKSKALGRRRSYEQMISN